MKTLIKNLLREVVRSNGPLSSAAFHWRSLGKHADLKAMDAAIDRVVGSASELAGSHLEILKRHFLKPQAPAPADPFSPEYRQWNMNQYQLLAGQNYIQQNEITVTSFESIRNRFMPFITGDARFTGHYLKELAFVIAHLPFKPGIKVLEMGAGWGNLSLALALLDASVTAVEINPAFCELLEHRVSTHGRKISVVQDDFVAFAESPGESYDIVVFEAAFHHCGDHLRLLEALSKRLNPGGTLVFAGEPFFKPGNPALPYPWGLRLDLASLVYVRRYGWLELGFAESHMAEACGRLGLRLKRISGAAYAAEDLFFATRN